MNEDVYYFKIVFILSSIKFMYKGYCFFFSTNLGNFIVLCFCYVVSNYLYEKC